jgi:hypothetical protein
MLPVEVFGIVLGENGWREALWAQYELARSASMEVVLDSQDEDFVFASIGGRHQTSQVLSSFPLLSKADLAPSEYVLNLFQLRPCTTLNPFWYSAGKESPSNLLAPIQLAAMVCMDMFVQLQGMFRANFEWNIVRLFLTVRLGLVSLYQAPRQERPTKEEHKPVKRLNKLLCNFSLSLR